MSTSYINKLQHPTLGEPWYEVTLRNWWCLGESKEKNLERGPLFEARLHGYYLSVAGDSLEKCEQSLRFMIDQTLIYREPDGLVVDHGHCTPAWRRAWSYLRHWRLRRSLYRHPGKIVLRPVSAWRYFWEDVLDA